MAELATIARPYAEALFKAAAGAGVEQIQQWLDAFAAVASNEDVLRVAQSPKVNREQVLSLFVGVANGELPVLVKNFLGAVVDNNRLAALPKWLCSFVSWSTTKKALPMRMCLARSRSLMQSCKHCAQR